MRDIIAALGLVFVLEGAIYVLFPKAVHNYMRQALELPPTALQKAGLAACLAGLGIVWLMRG